MDVAAPRFVVNHSPLCLEVAFYFKVKKKVKTQILISTKDRLLDNKQDSPHKVHVDTEGSMEQENE